jgi:hypothetical protein
MESTQKRRITWARRTGFLATVATGVTLLGTAVGGIASVDHDLQVAAVERHATPPTGAGDGSSEDWNDGGRPTGHRRSGAPRGDCPFRAERKL